MFNQSRNNYRFTCLIRKIHNGHLTIKPTIFLWLQFDVEIFSSGLGWQFELSCFHNIHAMLRNTRFLVFSGSYFVIRRRPQWYWTKRRNIYHDPLKDILPFSSIPTEKTFELLSVSNILNANLARQKSENEFSGGTLVTY